MGADHLGIEGQRRSAWTLSLGQAILTNQNRAETRLRFGTARRDRNCAAQDVLGFRKLAAFCQAVRQVDQDSAAARDQPVGLREVVRPAGEITLGLSCRGPRQPGLDHRRIGCQGHRGFLHCAIYVACVQQGARECGPQGRRSGIAGQQ